VEAVLFLLSVVLLAAYWRHALKAPYPLLQMALFKVRPFAFSNWRLHHAAWRRRIAIPDAAAVSDRLDLPAWQSGLLMMPTAAAGWHEVFFHASAGCFGYRGVLIVNTVMIGATINLYSLVSTQTPLIAIVGIGWRWVFQFAAIFEHEQHGLRDIETNESSMASTIASSFQQISMSFGLAFGSLVTAWYLGPLAQSDRFAVTTALHHAFLTLGGLTIVSSLSFWTLRQVMRERQSAPFRWNDFRQRIRMNNQRRDSRCEISARSDVKACETTYPDFFGYHATYFAATRSSRTDQFVAMRLRV